MFVKFKNIFFLITITIFTFLIINYYFSKKNIIYINKSRSNYTLELNNDLPLLANDTENIIVYKDGLQEFKKKRKRRFWEKLISNDKQ